MQPSDNPVTHAWVDSLLLALGVEDRALQRRREEMRWLHAALAAEFPPHVLEWLEPLVRERWDSVCEEDREWRRK